MEPVERIEGRGAAPREHGNRVFYKVPEAAARLDCSQNSIYRWLKRGKIHGGKGPGGVRVSASEVDLIARLILEGKI